MCNIYCYYYNFQLTFAYSKNIQCLCSISEYTYRTDSLNIQILNFRNHTLRWKENLTLRAVLDSLDGGSLIFSAGTYFVVVV